MASGFATEAALAPVTTPKEAARDRWIELALVLFVAFAPALLLSLHVTLFGIPENREHSNIRYLYLSMQQAGALGVLWYVLRRTGRTFSSLGLRMSIKGTVVGIVLCVAAVMAGGIARGFIEVIHKHYFGTYIARPNPALFVPKTGWVVLSVFLLLNCFLEEATVRAYLMTELSQLTGSMTFAAVASVVVQCSYHTYQGWLNVTGLAATFAVFAFYYARQRELFPVYIAHLAMDFFAAAYLFSR